MSATRLSSELLCLGSIADRLADSLAADLDWRFPGFADPLFLGTATYLGSFRQILPGLAFVADGLGSGIASPLALVFAFINAERSDACLTLLA